MSLNQIQAPNGAHHTSLTLASLLKTYWLRDALRSLSVPKNSRPNALLYHISLRRNSLIQNHPRALTPGELFGWAAAVIPCRNFVSFGFRPLCDPGAIKVYRFRPIIEIAGGGIKITAPPSKIIRSSGITLPHLSLHLPCTQHPTTNTIELQKNRNVSPVMLPGTVLPHAGTRSESPHPLNQFSKNTSRLTTTKHFCRCPVRLSPIGSNFTQGQSHFPNARRNSQWQRKLNQIPRELQT